MRNRKVFTLVLVIVLIFSFGIFAQNQEDSTKNAYQKVVKAINEWVETTPKQEYKEVESDQLFQWKLKLEENTFGYGRYKVLEELLKKIEDREFSYNMGIYNSKSIRYFQLNQYSMYYRKAKQRSEDPVDPNNFLLQKYEYYQSYIESKQEQWLWLSGFISFLSSSYAESIANENYDILSQILNQYIFLTKHYLEKNPDKLMKASDLYSTASTFAQATVDLILRNLHAFSASAGSYLEEEERKLILNFVLPKYKDRDMAVKIYKALK